MGQLQLHLTGARFVIVEFICEDCELKWIHKLKIGELPILSLYCRNGQLILQLVYHPYLGDRLFECSETNASEAVRARVFGEHLNSYSLFTSLTVWFQGIALVGIGSFLFHATLLYEAQLADELPMIYVGSMSLFITFDDGPGHGIKSRRSKILIALLLLFDVLFTWS
jgi:hypothetical protein